MLPFQVVEDKQLSTPHISNVQSTSVPVSWVTVSKTASSQTPVEISVLNADKASSGWNDPVKGAVPAVILVAAPSSK